MAYLTVTQLKAYVDVRRLCELLSDDDAGTPVSEASLPTNDYLLELLEAGAADIDAAARRANAYTLDELTAFAATTRGARLRRLNAALTWGHIVGRRKYAADKVAELCPEAEKAEQDLEQLRLGERIFDTANAPQAGLPEVVSLGADVPGSIASKSGLWGSLAMGYASVYHGDAD